MPQRAAPTCSWSLGRHEEARAHSATALDTCRDLGIDFLSHDLTRVLALAEAKLGRYDEATARLEAVIAAKTARGVTALELGAMHEARARVAIEAGDRAAFDIHAGFAAKEYRSGRGSVLGARWERLMAEARRASEPAYDADGARKATTQVSHRTAAQRVTEALAPASTAEERAQRALALLCQERGSRVGYLYLLREGDLALVAAHGEAEPPEGLRDHVRNYWERSVSEESDSTAALTGTQVASILTGATHFRDAAEHEYQTVLLTSAGTDTSRHVGVAAFTSGTAAAAPGGAALVVSVSTYLRDYGIAK